MSADSLPPAEEGLRAVVEGSEVYQSLVDKLAMDAPTDAWRVDGRSHFVYPLKPDEDGEGAVAMFVIRWDDYAPLTAVIIRPDPAGGDPKVTSLI